MHEWAKPRVTDPPEQMVRVTDPPERKSRIPLLAGDLRSPVSMHD